MNGKLKIKEIAAQTGLSISTVSRVLSGKFNTSEKAKQRVLTCAREYGVLDDIASGRLRAATKRNFTINEGSRSSENADTVA
ncbi:MAG: LacI family DNA-binding transcriptional regulator [Symbiopectobacterium sp.]|uniref:LacI family DNA-binding transcriptional regulator n=1 Tax=Symbiopectobacterium sp. TaxID=2952789 RepID=UPI0039E9EF5F